MSIVNGLVRCVGYRTRERLFSIGKLYRVDNGSITNDRGHCYRWQFDLLATNYYIFEQLSESEMVCGICGETITNEDYMVVGNVIVCTDCVDENGFFCEECGRAMLEDDCHFINDSTICPTCFEHNYRICECCGEVVHRLDSYVDIRGNTVCDDCRGLYYHACVDCDELVHEDDVYWGEDDEPRCHDCHIEYGNRCIRNYRFKPIPTFYGSDDDYALYMGVELEVDKGGEDSENARALLDCMNANAEHIYIKHDGSIYDGFEIVSHPATLEYHTANNMNWYDLVQLATELGYRSHDTDTCGLHVHVSRKGLGNDLTAQEETISRILYFVENNWDYVLRFTRRSESRLAQWASRYGIENSVEATYKKAKGDWNRYRCINLLNDNTIEFRIFRGTLNYTTFIATLQFVNVLCMVCKNTDTAKMEKLTWAEFVDYIDPTIHPQLISYLKKRGLYTINV